MFHSFEAAKLHYVVWCCRFGSRTVAPRSENWNANPAKKAERRSRRRTRATATWATRKSPPEWSGRRRPSSAAPPSLRRNRRSRHPHSRMPPCSMSFPYTYIVIKSFSSALLLGLPCEKHSTVTRCVGVFRGVSGRRTAGESARWW